VYGIELGKGLEVVPRLLVCHVRDHLIVAILH
jgi:hypothetical protein